jgi:hypothetical protein
MAKTNIVAEGRTEKKLKNYLSVIAHHCGEEYAAEIVVTDDSVKKAISRFSSKFEKDKEEDIIYALLKGSIISDDREKLDNHLVSALIEDNDMPLLVEYFKNNLLFRRSVAFTFIENSTRLNEDILNANSEKNQSLENLEKFRDYKLSVERQKKFTLNK